MFKTYRKYRHWPSVLKLRLPLNQVALTPALTMEVMMMYVELSPNPYLPLAIVSMISSTNLLPC